MKKFSDIIVDACKAQGVSATDAKEVAKGVIDGLEDGIVKDGGVSIYGLCDFNVVDTKARTGRNPATGEAIEIKANKAVKVKISSALKKKVKI
jgi:DNA-binding protein HU-beta